MEGSGVIPPARRALAREMVPGVQQYQGADDRHDDARRMERGTVRRPAERARDETADNGAGHPEHPRHQESNVLGTRHDQAGDGADDDADDEHPDVVKHGRIPPWVGVDPGSCVTA